MFKKKPTVNLNKYIHTPQLPLEPGIPGSLEFFFYVSAAKKTRENLPKQNSNFANVSLLCQ